MKKLSGISIPKSRGEEIRSRLVKHGHLNPEYRILDQGESLIIPLKESISECQLERSLDDNFSEMEIVEVNFDSLGDVMASAQSSAAQTAEPKIKALGVVILIFEVGSL